MLLINKGIFCMQNMNRSRELDYYSIKKFLIVSGTSDVFQQIYPSDSKKSSTKTEKYLKPKIELRTTRIPNI